MKRNPIPSPCIGICEFIDGECRGCYRTQDEAYEWYELTDENRDVIWKRFIQKSKEQ